MTPSPVRRGRIGPPWYQSRAKDTCARLRIKGTFAAAVARVGQKMFMKSNIKYTKKFRMSLTRKLTSLQARSRRKQDHKLRVQASSLSLQAQGSGSRDRGGRAQASGHKQLG